MITHQKLSFSAWKIFLDGELVGYIQQVTGGYAYSPKGHNSWGDTYPSFDECFKSLQTPEESINVDDLLQLLKRAHNELIEHGREYNHITCPTLMRQIEDVLTTGTIPN